jgi:hypothetical protein
MAIVGGLVAAIFGGIIWSVLVGATEYEIKWFAIGIGALVGFVMSVMTPVRSDSLGVYAALLALLGLGAGKFLGIEKAYIPAAKRAILADEQALTVAFAVFYYERGQFSPDLQDRLARYGGNLDSLDAMPEDLVEDMVAEATERMRATSPADRERVVRGLINSALARTTFSERFKSTLGPFDILWSLAAIAAAWRIMKGD